FPVGFGGRTRGVTLVTIRAPRDVPRLFEAALLRAEERGSLLHSLRPDFARRFAERSIPIDRGLEGFGTDAFPETCSPCLECWTFRVRPRSLRVARPSALERAQERRIGFGLGLGFGL